MIASLEKRHIVEPRLNEQFVAAEAVDGQQTYSGHVMFNPSSSAVAALAVGGVGWGGITFGVLSPKSTAQSISRAVMLNVPG